MDSGILQNIRVLDLTRYVSGPYCGVLLADMGAEVIKVEKPDTGEVSRTVAPYFGGVSLFFPPYNRSKKSVTANLRTPEGIAPLPKNFEPYSSAAMLSPTALFSSAMGL